MSSETEPLLDPVAPYSTANDPEAPNTSLNGDIQDGRPLVRWRAKTARVLESPTLHKTVIALIAIDATCVLADLTYTILSPTCTPIEGEQTPIWLNILANISLVITSLFVLEVPITLWALGFDAYNPFGPVPHASLHLFDATVVLTTFVLEVVLRGKERELAGLLILLRLWRLVKLVGGIAVGAGELEEETLKKLNETRAQLRDAIGALADAKAENEQLKAQLVALDRSTDEL